MVGWKRVNQAGMERMNIFEFGLGLIFFRVDHVFNY